MDKAKGKRVHFSPFPGYVLCTGVAVVNTPDAVSSFKELTI